MPKKKKLNKKAKPVQNVENESNEQLNNLNEINSKLSKLNIKNNELNIKNEKKKHKSNLGQFYTTNYQYILQNMQIPEDIKIIIEPFTGKGDLLNFIKNKDKYILELYDLDPKYSKTIKRDTLLNPPSYDNKFVLTNPPYLARNKNKDKTLYDKYNCNDLYKCFINNLIDSKCLGGIIIIPLNFLCSIRKSDIDLRKLFCNKFEMKIINIFEEKVFDDTSYTICSIYFIQKNKDEDRQINANIYPANKKINILLNKENNFTFGGELYNLPLNKKIIIKRATKKNKDSKYLTNIFLKCIDDNIDSQLGLKMVENKDIFIDTTSKLSERSYASICINNDNKTVLLEDQKKIILEFNKFIKTKRDKYNSLFLSNYRDSNSIARKRISFDLTFKIINYLMATSV